MGKYTKEQWNDGLPCRISKVRKIFNDEEKFFGDEWKEGKLVHLDDLKETLSCDGCISEADQRVLLEELKELAREAELKPPHKEILDQIYFEGESRHQIAKEYGQSVNNICQKERRSLWKMRKAAIRKGLRDWFG